MFKIGNLFENDDVEITAQLGAFTVIQWKRDLSVDRFSAQNAWFAAQMNVRRRQVICELAKSPVTVQAGAMQWSVGQVNATTGVKGVGDFFGKALRATLEQKRRSLGNNGDDDYALRAKLMRYAASHGFTPSEILDEIES